ncbi:Rrf2 family transcriptional regulator [Candidatus Gracilibacteria bacterium]|nr:Rrf2 family transcriptional regulator [Candidatus Gracilibacteria bacterium]MCF7856458.1 Rrf2 family transcriptional regulator [Candidatus Gracilibacteria bacterium]MCF7896754.1 Rrf2 family transcriptional regulator [Candidatus Gracilibacteria bacterium]
MQFSKAAEYAIIGLTHLVSAENQSASVGQIAHAEKLSLYFLRNVFQKLRDAKLVESKRGSGYTLTKNPKNISLKDILETVERKLVIHACLQKKESGCARAKNCKIVYQLAKVQKRMLADLDKISLIDLI